MTDENRSDNNENSIPEYVWEAVNNDSKIPADQKEVVAQTLHQKLKELNVANDETAAQKALPTLVAAAGAALLFMPKESRAASPGAFIDAILEEALAPIMSLLETLISGAMSIYDQFITGGAQSTSGTLTSSTDAQNHVKTQIEENRLKAATAPTPKQCDSDAVGKQSVIAEAQQSARSEAMLFGLSAGAASGDEDLAAKDFERQIETHGSSGQNLNVFSIVKDEGIQNDEDEKAASDYLKNTVSIDTRSPTNANINETLHSGAKQKAYKLMAEKAKATNRRQVAMKPLVTAKAVNDNRDGAGVRKVMTTETRRTFGADSGGWREEIRGYADPTPLLAELNLLTSFSNFVAVKQYETLLEGNMTDSVHLLELLDK